MSEHAQAALEAAVAFANALAAHGQTAASYQEAIANRNAAVSAAVAFAEALTVASADEPVPSEYHNLLNFTPLEIDAALKGQPTLMENHRDALLQALQAS